MKARVRTRFFDPAGHVLSWNAGAASVLLLWLAACGNAGRAPAAGFPRDTVLLRAMLEAEDARPTTAEALAPLLSGMTSPQPELRAWAVRAMGRFERDSLAPVLAPALQDSSATVRAAAAVAIAQAVHRGEPAHARATLLQQLAREDDAGVRAILAESLGRLRPEDADQVRATAERLLALAAPAESSEPQVTRSTTMLGVTKGLFFLVRRPDTRAALPAAVAPLLHQLADYGRATDTGLAEPDSGALTARRIRRLALAASTPAGAADAAVLDAAMDDPDPWVRREAALAGGALDDRAAARRIAERALGDAAAPVRLEGVRALSRQNDITGACTPILSAAADPDGHVALQAIDVLGARCAAQPGVPQLLDSLSGTLPDPGASHARWHRASHALVALATARPERARDRLPAFVASPNPFVRGYAAVAAARLSDEPTLRTLAQDSVPNVRTAAVQGLAAVIGRAADDLYIDQLAQHDSQLLQAAAAALEGSTDARAVPALLDALERITARARETERDARAALITRVGELAAASAAPRMQPYLSDYDSVIARHAADLLARWTGEPVRPAPRPLPRLPAPTPAELQAIDRVRLVLELEEGGEIELRPLPWVAPTNATRFVRLAREGYYDGLTIHRVASNFVLQGGSPAANEYAGDGPYTRDEVGAANWRGTVGLSTRGRDTGDAQLYINLVDNVRLDHDYTIWAEVTRGMDIADAVLEGTVIRRVTVH